MTGEPRTPLNADSTPELRRSDSALQQDVLDIHSLSVTFGGNKALSEVALKASTGDVIAVIGPNGAGKTTLLNAIGRIVPSTGRVMIGGQDTSRMRIADVAGCGVARSFQDPPLLDRESVVQNVMCGGHRLLDYRMFDQVVRRVKVRKAEAELEERARRLIDLVGLTAQADKPAGGLPFGSRKLVDIARAVVSRPRLLLLDEPSSGVDRGERETLASIILELRKQQGVAILVVEHHMDLVRAIATHVFAMQGGRPFMHGTPTEVLDSEKFRGALVGGSKAEDAAVSGNTKG